MAWLLLLLAALVFAGISAAALRREHDKTFFTTAITACALIALAPISAIGEYQDGLASHTDPRHGWVTVKPGIYKTCDGATLIYKGTRGVIPNSPECGATP